MSKNSEKRSNVKPLQLDTLLGVLEKSEGVEMFQSIYAEIEGVKKDITEKGNLSCGFFVSGVLAIFGLIDRLHGTVSGTVSAMERSGWQKTGNLSPGAVIVWGPPVDGSFSHDHIGFYLGDQQAISNIWQKRVPGKHHVTFGAQGTKTYRPILAVYEHNELSPNNG